ncbi:MAG: D-cysteine desulfhydrase family protein [Cellvibrionaceae bacterium]
MKKNIPFQYPDKLSLAQTPTPLQPLDRLSAHLSSQLDKKFSSPRIWIKRDDLTGSVLSGNKIRKLEFVIAQAISDGCDTLITCGGIQSNHCRATAIVGAQLGLNVCLILRNETNDSEPVLPDGNLLLDVMSGAEIYQYAKFEYQKELSNLFEEHRQRLVNEGKKPFTIPTGASDEIGVWGYVAAAEELNKNFKTHNINPQHIIVASGSGGTQAGLTVGAHLFDLDAEVIGMAVCDNEAYFINKVLSDISDWKNRYHLQIDLEKIPIAVNDKYIGPGYGKASAEVFDTIKLLARLEGIVLDPVYTGKAFHGMIEEVLKGNFSGEEDIVFVHTGGVFGLFPQKQFF